MSTSVMQQLEALSLESYHFLFYDATNYTGVVSPAACAALNVAALLMFWLVHVILDKIWRVCSDGFAQLETLKQMEVLHNTTSAVSTAVLGLLYIRAAYDTRTTVVSRWESTNYFGQIGLLINCALTFYEITLYIFYFKKGFEFWIHHILVLINFLPILVVGHLGHWGYFDGTVEFTNVFLAYVSVSRIFESKGGILYVIAGFGSWVSFFLLRMVGMGYWMYQFAMDFYTHPEVFERNLNYAKYTAFPTTLFLFVLSSYWFIPITKGFFKAIGFPLCPESAKKTERKKEK